MARLLLFILLIVVLPAFAQKNFVPAHVTTSEGATLVGEIDYRAWTVNPLTIAFRYAAGEDVQRLEAKDAVSFQIDCNQEKYISAEVNLIAESTQFGSLPVYRNLMTMEREPNRVTARLFLRVVVEGALNLYQFIDVNHRVHYYLQAGDGPIRELTYRRVQMLEYEDWILEPGMVRSNENSNIIVVETYKSELAAAMDDRCPEVSRRIDHLRYTDLIAQLVVAYNQCVGKQTYRQVREKNYHAFYLQAGTMRSLARANDQSSIATPDLPGHQSFYWGLGYEFALPRSRDQTILGLEVNFFGNRAAASVSVPAAEGTQRNIDYQLSLAGMQWNFFGKYHPVKGALSPYLKAGLSVLTYQVSNFIVDDRRPTNYIYDRQAIRDAELTGIVGAGLQYGKFYVEGRYSPGTDINPTTGYDLTVDRWSLVAGYRFSR